jgi:hypothetical protein
MWIGNNYYPIRRGMAKKAFPLAITFSNGRATIAEVHVDPGFELKNFWEKVLWIVVLF